MIKVLVTDNDKKGLRRPYGFSAKRSMGSRARRRRQLETKSGIKGPITCSGNNSCSSSRKKIFLG